MTISQRLVHQSLDLIESAGLRTNVPLADAVSWIADAARYPVGGAAYRDRLEQAKFALEWELARVNNALPCLPGSGTASPGPHAEPSVNGHTPPPKRPLHAAYCDTQGEAERKVVELENAYPGTQFRVTEEAHGWCVDAVTGWAATKEPV